MFLKKAGDFIHAFAFRRFRVLCAVSDCNDGNNNDLRVDIQHSAQKCLIADSHNQSVKPKLPRLQDQIFVLQTKIVSSPAIAKLVGGCSVAVKSGAAPDKARNNQRACAFAICGVESRQSLAADALQQLRRGDDGIARSLGILLGRRKDRGFQHPADQRRIGLPAVKMADTSAFVQ